MSEPLVFDASIDLIFYGGSMGSGWQVLDIRRGQLVIFWRIPSARERIHTETACVDGFRSGRWIGVLSKYPTQLPALIALLNVLHSFPNSPE